MCRCLRLIVSNRTPACGIRFNCTCAKYEYSWNGITLSNLLLNNILGRASNDANRPSASQVRAKKFNKNVNYAILIPSNLTWMQNTRRMCSLIFPFRSAENHLTIELNEIRRRKPLQESEQSPENSNATEIIIVINSWTWRGRQIYMHSRLF